VYLLTRLLTVVNRFKGVLSYLGLSLGIFALAGGLIAANIQIPALITISMAMFAICFALVTLSAYVMQRKSPLHLGSAKFILLVVSQLGMSLFLLGLIYISPFSALPLPLTSVAELLKVSAISMLIFFVILYLLLISPGQFKKINYASPFMLMGVFFPAALNLAAFVIHFSVCRCPGSLVSIFLIPVAFTDNIFKDSMPLFSPFDRRLIVDTMKMGWVFVDQDEIILDANQAVEIILGKRVDDLIGQSASPLIPNWSTLFPPDSLYSEKELHASINHNGKRIYFHVRSLPVLQDGEFTGRVLFWNDVTERREGEDIRKRTMDTTLGLLHSISLAASHTTDIRAFLETAIFQIVTSFSCSLGFIFMRDIEFFDEGKALLELVGTYSVLDLPDTEKIASSLNPYLSSLATHQEVIHIKNTDLPPAFEALKTEENMGELVICPVIIESQLQGAIVLFRPGKTTFIRDEIIRLDMLANELSTLIHVEQQRSGYASMAERKKITRILHDTVTQQLYGLLIFTDVARTQLESGTINSLAATLERLTQTGRQALKEMRMFLHSLQTVNVSKIGLEAAVNQRLDAVEARANIQTQLLFSKDVTLTLKQELCLYEITLEALNNILRHAYAKSVTVNLKKSPKNIQLVIIDDGRGFDVKYRKDSGGIGLKNMTESAKQIHAKIVFSSKPHMGTTVKILIPRTDLVSKNNRSHAYL